MKRILVLALTMVLAVACSDTDDASIVGTASADDGNVLSGITVKLYSESTDLIAETQTDAEGNFSFTGLDGGNYYIGATITVDGTVWDTGNTPQSFYVSGEIEKIVALTLRPKG